MARVNAVSMWSVVIRKTDNGYQARVFKGDAPMGSGPSELPEFYNASTLGGLFAILTEEIPALPDNFRPLQKQAAE